MYKKTNNVLIIFCKAPLAGQVKTRLQPELSAQQAALCHQKLSLLTLERARLLTDCALQLCCAPDTTHPFFQTCAAHYPLELTVQRGVDLGERMANALAEALKKYAHALLIGCDCPSLSVKDLEQAFSALQTHDVVVAPAEDGGYVLIGMNSVQTELFSAMRWGHDKVMSTTRQRIRAKNLKFFELPMQWDVDTPTDLARWNFL